MEIGLREWLIVIGIIVIAGILFDGWRRMRGGKGKLKFRLDRNLSNLPDEDSSAELLGTHTLLPIPYERAILVIFMCVMIPLGYLVFKRVELRCKTLGTLSQH